MLTSFADCTVNNLHSICVDSVDAIVAFISEHHHFLYHGKTWLELDEPPHGLVQPWIFCLICSMLASVSSKQSPFLSCCSTGNKASYFVHLYDHHEQIINLKHLLPHHLNIPGTVEEIIYCIYFPNQPAIKSASLLFKLGWLMFQPTCSVLLLPFSNLFLYGPFQSIIQVEVTFWLCPYDTWSALNNCMII